VGIRFGTDLTSKFPGKLASFGSNLVAGLVKVLVRGYLASSIRIANLRVNP